MMRKIALLLNCLISANHVWHAQSSTDRLAHSRRTPEAHGRISARKALAALLLGPTPATAFHTSGAGQQVGAKSPHATSRPLRHAPVAAVEADTAGIEKETAPAVNVDSAAAAVRSAIAADDITQAPKPGLAEKELFQCDASCQVWEEFPRYADTTALGSLQTAAATVAKYMPKPLDRLGGAMRAVEYWAKHAARTSYYAANAMAGLAAFQVRGAEMAESDGVGAGLVSVPQLAAGQILESVMVYEQDWQRIVEGKYAMPWDMAAGNRQTTLPYALRQSARFVEEAVGTMERRARGTAEDRKIWLQSGDIYPEYYKTNYHYQTDGWMSKKSADVYETSTETLFLGRQDASQRASLVPLHGLQGVGGRPLKILEVACGTGRFGTFLRDNHPTAEVTFVDLSPFYLEAARENDEYWRTFKSSSNGGRPYARASFVQAAAENLPFDAGSFDAVVCVYLFHEMPEGPRAAAAAEMARVLAPGGTLVLTDSIQRGDRSTLDDLLVGFENLNEPHYRNYISTNLPDLFTRHGLECGQKFVACTSKTLSFTKPR